jgi:putative membrane protein
MKRLLALTLVFVSFLIFTTALSAKSHKESSKDKKFVTQAATGGMYEAEAARIALEKASGPEVKKFAQRMVDDHTKANQELMALVEKKKLAPVQKLDKKHEEMLEKLRKKSGSDFDKEYMEQNLKEHKSAVSLFEKESKSGKDADLKSFASNTLPTLKEHLGMAEEMTKSSKP